LDKRAAPDFSAFYRPEDGGNGIFQNLETCMSVCVTSYGTPQTLYVSCKIFKSRK